MRVWQASFELAQERLLFLLLSGLGIAVIGGKLDRLIGADEARGMFAFLPRFLGIEIPLIRLGLMLLAAWVLLSIASTVRIRLKIRRENQLRPKR